jgi:predicted metal-binding membrane protein
MVVDFVIALQGTRWPRERGFLGTSAILFMASAAATVHWCRSMSGSMAMPGGWTMSMAWMRMSGQTCVGAAATFMGMWVVMMAAMMMPSLVPMLLRYRGSVHGPDEARIGRLTALVGAGYLFVWAIFGAAVYPLGLVSTAAEMQWHPLARSVPIATGVVLLLAGWVQLSAWKARELARCRDVPGCEHLQPMHTWTAWQYGLHLGVHCSLCCSGFMLVLVATGVMDLRAMAILTAAITIERLSPRPQPAARAAGVALIGVATLVIARALTVA